IVDQVKPDGSFDEHKCLLGWTNAKDAWAGYLANYAPGWMGCGAIRAATMPAFKAWLESGNTGKPFENQRVELGWTDIPDHLLLAPVSLSAGGKHTPAGYTH